MSVAGDRLRTLVGDYYHGLLTFESYREQRAKLLDELQTGAPEVASKESPAEASRPRAPTKAPVPERAAAAPAVSALPTQDSAPRRSSRMLTLAAAAGVALIAVVLVAYRFLQTDVTPAPPGSTEAIPTAGLPPGAAQLEQFMQRGAWHPDAVRNLEVTWNSALTDEERTTARASPSFARFADALRNRLRAEEALSDARRSEELESLVNLARTLQMPYADSLTVPARAPVTTTTNPASADGRVEITPPAVARTEVEAGAATPGESRADAPAAPQAAERSAPPAVAAASSPNAADAVPQATAAPAQPEAPRNNAGTECNVQLLNTRRPFCRDALRTGGDAPALVIVPAGKFQMGSDQRAESPAHEVVIGAALAMAVYETSFGDFNAYCTAAGVRCPDNPWSSADYPVVLVSWNEAVAYTEWLTEQTGHRYRLPTEAEWEYAARAGTQSPYPFGDAVTPAAARSSANGAVSSPLPSSDDSVNRNGFRLLHMIGNVREWVADGWQADYQGAPADGSARPAAGAAPRVVRGGAYSDGPRPLRSAARTSLAPDANDRLTGFRVVRELSD
jgi:formylglycine-generating enzyme required for sulfatase activity